MRIWSSFKAFIAYFIASVRLGCNIVYKITFSLIFIAFCIRLISAYSTHAGFSVKLLCICMFHSALPHCLSFGALQCQQNTTLANVCLETEFTNTTNNCISVQHRLQHKLSMWMKTKICIGPATVLARKQANINKLAVAESRNSSSLLFPFKSSDLQQHFSSVSEDLKFFFGLWPVFTHFQSNSCIWPFQEEWTSKGCYSSGWTNVVSTQKRQLGKEQVLNCVFWYKDII